MYRRVFAAVTTRRGPLRWSNELAHKHYITTVAAVKETENEYLLVPRLPVPALKDTVARYLQSTRVLLTPDEYSATARAAAEFVSGADDGFDADGGKSGLGKILQQRLVQLDAHEPFSWLEALWLRKAYLEWREPSVVNVNWWCQLADNAALFDAGATTGVTPAQLGRAATLVANILAFKRRIDARTLPQEFVKKEPLCMHQYTNVLATTRIPGPVADSIASAHPSTARHIIVMANNQLYALNVLASDGLFPLSLNALVSRLGEIAADALQGPIEPSVGLLTAGSRDTNYKGYSRLQSLSPQNAANLDTIRTSLFFVCLDNASKNPDPSKNSPEATHEQIFHNYDASNRWFDKAIQLIVLPSGRAGVNGEHSPTDAVIPGNMMDFIVKTEASDPSNAISADVAEVPRKLHWVVDTEIEKLIQEASNTATALIKDTKSCLLQTDIYGSQFIKENVKASPDAFVQVALQLAWRRVHTEPTAVYESASLRLFSHGRTETIRSLTEDTWAFVVSFDQPGLTNDEKRDLFQKAVKSQANMAREATYGRGVDRHLLALRTLIEGPEEAKRATLFNDPAYIKSMYFKLSTSNMSPGDSFYGGFGPVVPDGYGINYAIGKDNLKFSISHKPSAAVTDGGKFREALYKSLVDLKQFFE
ncbi:hypothetical protein HK100_012876 [Physocladia obscura]|uniref:Choline/carnitine acyltransferase domain-containing protein n=1 Tax=Physocladia obscura TaxID=109957 RepID=A0AAD5T902_9FUNG|nr:hypothetical protein HK100_012876 [Physocladia obscura]